MATASDFDPRFQDPKPGIHFHHIINPSNRSLTVKIHGLNLTHTFNHIATAVPSLLERKTTGLLALVHGQRRIALS